MVAIMGPPPLDFLQRSKKSKQFWDEKGISNTLLPGLQILTHHRGNWIGHVPIPAKSLESSDARLQGEEKELFLIFIRKMLRWRPEDRSDIQDLFTDEWFCADLIESGDVVRQTEPEPAKVAAVVEDIEKAAENEASSYTSHHTIT